MPCRKGNGESTQAWAKRWVDGLVYIPHPVVARHRIRIRLWFWAWAVLLGGASLGIMLWVLRGG